MQKVIDVNFNDSEEIERDLTITWGIWVNYPIIRKGCRSRFKVLKSVSFLLLYVDIFYL